MHNSEVKRLIPNKCCPRGINPTPSELDKTPKDLLKEHINFLTWYTLQEPHFSIASDKNTNK